MIHYRKIIRDVRKRVTKCLVRKSESIRDDKSVTESKTCHIRDIREEAVG